jgi:hypothetical protein
MWSFHDMLMMLGLFAAGYIVAAGFVTLTIFAGRLRRREVRRTDRARIIALVGETNLAVVWAGRVVVFRCGKQAWRVVVPDRAAEVTCGRVEAAVDLFLAEVDGCARGDGGGPIIDNKSAVDAGAAAD